MAIGRKVNDVSVPRFDGGVNFSADPLEVESNESPDSLNVEYRDGIWGKRLGRTKLFTSTLGASATGHSCADFGATVTGHKQVMHFSTAVYSMTAMAGTPVSIRSGAPNVRSYNTKAKQYIIQSYTDYSDVYYWDGAASSMSALSTGKANFKHSIEFQGYLLGLNVSGYKMRMIYEDTATMVGGDFDDYITLTPAPNDDEITGAFILNGRCYVHSVYSIFRVSFVGGVTVFDHKQVVSDVGVVPGTVQLITHPEHGQVAQFLAYDKRVYIFDGSNLKDVSTKFYSRNDSCEMALSLIEPNALDGCFSVLDSSNNIYRLFIPRKGSLTNTHMFATRVENFACYPSDNQPFASGMTAFDNVGNRYVVCLGYDGFAYKLDDGNTDAGTAIVEHWSSPVIRLKDANFSKATELILYLEATGKTKLQVLERVDFLRVWRERCLVDLHNSRDRFVGSTFALGTGVLGGAYTTLVARINLPVTFNAYQLKLTSAGQINAQLGWKVLRVDANMAVLSVGKAEAQR